MSNDAELIESTIQTIAHLTHSSNALQDKLRANAASGECAKSTNLTMIAAADRIDELERQLAEAQNDQADKARLDFVLENDAFLMREFTTSVSFKYQLATQDEDEEYIRLSGEGISFDTPRQAIDAAIQKVKT